MVSSSKNKCLRSTITLSHCFALQTLPVKSEAQWYNNFGGRRLNRYVSNIDLDCFVEKEKRNEDLDKPNSKDTLLGDGPKLPAKSIFSTNLKVKLELKEPGRFSCSQCDKTFNSKSGLAYHMEKDTGKFRLWCYQCQRGFTMRAQYESHMAKHEGRSFPCEYCPKRFQSKPSLRVHVLKCHSTTEPFQNLPPESH